MNWLAAALCLPLWALAAEPAQPNGGKLSLEVGERKVLHEQSLARVAVGDPAVVDVRAGGSGDLILTGLTAGRTTLLVWKESGGRESILVSVNEYPESGRLQSLGVEGPDPAVPLELAVGAERVVPLRGFTGANVADPDVCDVVVRGEGAVVLKGKKAGETTLEVSTGGMQVVYDVIVTDGAATSPPPVPLVLGVGAQKALTLAGLERVAVSDPRPLRAERLGDDRLLLTGVRAGKSTLTLWCADGKRFAYAVAVSAPATLAPTAAEPEKPSDEEARIELRLAAGTARSLSIPGVQRVAVGDPEVAEVEAVGSSRLKVQGKRAGTTALLSWNASGRNTPITIVVEATETSAPGAVSDVTPALVGSLVLDVGATLARALPGVRRVVAGAPGVVEARVSGAGFELTGRAPGETVVLAWGPGAERVLYSVRVKTP